MCGCNLGTDRESSPILFAPVRTVFEPVRSSSALHVDVLYDADVEFEPSLASPSHPSPTVVMRPNLGVQSQAKPSLVAPPDASLLDVYDGDVESEDDEEVWGILQVDGPSDPAPAASQSEPSVVQLDGPGDPPEQLPPQQQQSTAAGSAQPAAQESMGGDAQAQGPRVPPPGSAPNSAPPTPQPPASVPSPQHRPQMVASPMGGMVVRAQAPGAPGHMSPRVSHPASPLPPYPVPPRQSPHPGHSPHHGGPSPGPLGMSPRNVPSVSPHPSQSPHGSMGTPQSTVSAPHYPPVPSPMGMHAPTGAPSPHPVQSPHPHSRSTTPQMSPRGSSQSQPGTPQLTPTSTPSGVPSTPTTPTPNLPIAAPGQPTGTTQPQAAPGMGTHLAGAPPGTGPANMGGGQIGMVAGQPEQNTGMLGGPGGPVPPGMAPESGGLTSSTAEGSQPTSTMSMMMMRGPRPQMMPGLWFRHRARCCLPQHWPNLFQNCRGTMFLSGLSGGMPRPDQPGAMQPLSHFPGPQGGGGPHSTAVSSHTLLSLQRLATGNWRTVFVCVVH